MKQTKQYQEVGPVDPISKDKPKVSLAFFKVEINQIGGEHKKCEGHQDRRSCIGFRTRAKHKILLEHRGKQPKDQVVKNPGRVVDIVVPKERYQGNIYNFRHQIIEDTSSVQLFFKH